MTDDKSNKKAPLSLLHALRFNEGKLDFSLIPIPALSEEIKVWMAGEKKYGRYNWKKLWGDKTTETVMASLLRHSFAILKGEVTDPETGLYHAAHIRCNAAMLIEYYEQTNKLLEVKPEVKYRVDYEKITREDGIRIYTEILPISEVEKLAADTAHVRIFKMVISKQEEGDI